MRKIFIGIFFLAVLDANSQSDTIHWQNLSPLPSTPRIDYASFVIDSDYYIVGGIDSALDWFSEVWKYNVQNNTWQQMSNFPGGPISTAAGFALNGYGYICSGGDSISNYNVDNEFWKYYPGVDTWQHKANYPGTSREAPVSFLYNSAAFVGMGWNVGGNDMWRYTLGSDSWDSVSRFPGGSRSECGVAVVDSFAYIFGGFNINTEYNDIWRYDITHNRWDSMGAMPGLWRSNVLFWTFDSLVLGGYGELENSTGNVFMGSDIYCYHVNSSKWDTLTCLNFPDSIADDELAGCFVIGKKGYFYGGYKTFLVPTYYNNMWSFDASQFFPPDTTIGILEVKNQDAFSVYPNPANHDQNFSISTSESGEIIFYDALDRKLDDRKLARGLNQIKLSTDDEVVFYKATLLDGATANGKIVFLK